MKGEKKEREVTAQEKGPAPPDLNENLIILLLLINASYCLSTLLTILYVSQSQR